VLGVDTLVEAMPASMQAGGSGIGFGPDGQISVGPAFGALEAAWMSGVAAMVRAGANVILDEAFLGGASSQRRWLDVLAGLQVLWAGCAVTPGGATKRELRRSDRIPGMAASQARLVHQGVSYDVEVDTSRTDAMVCARVIAAHVIRAARRDRGRDRRPPGHRASAVCRFRGAFAAAGHLGSQLSARGDAQLGEDVGKMGLDGPP
jgi:chloramphenicol 3-O phosphotransferase